MKYKCPKCNQNTGYIAPYGLPDSVICKCEGLKEVGRIVNKKYIPHSQIKNEGLDPSTLKNFGVYFFKDFKIIELKEKIDVELFEAQNNIWGATKAFESNPMLLFAVIDQLNPKNTCFFSVDSGWNIKDIGYVVRIPYISEIKEIINYIRGV